MSSFESPLMRDIEKLTPYALLGMLVSVGILFIIPLVGYVICGNGMEILKEVEKTLFELVFNFDHLIIKILLIMTGLFLVVFALISVIKSWLHKSKVKN